MNNTQPQVFAANTGTSCATNSGSYLIATPDRDGGGYFMHVDEWQQLVSAVNSRNSTAAKEILDEARERYEFLEAMLPATPLNPENLEELFADLDDCKALMNNTPRTLQKFLMGGFKNKRQEGENIDEIDREGRKVIDTTLHKIPLGAQHPHKNLPL